MKILEPHPLALIPPPLTKEEDDSMEQSLIKNGQLEDIVIYEGKILNGNHKYRKLIKNGISPRLVPFIPNGVATAEDFVLAHLEGRNMTLGQKAGVAAKLTQLKKKNPIDNLKLNHVKDKAPTKNPISKQDKNYRDYKNRTETKVAEALGVGSNSVTKMSVLLKHDKQLFEKVYCGKSSVDAAYQEHRRNVGSEKKPTPKTVLNLDEFKTKIIVPNVFCSEEQLEIFIKTMNAHGWIWEARGANGEVRVNWYGNGFASVGTNWSHLRPEFKLKNALIVAAQEKKDKLR